MQQNMTRPIRAQLHFLTWLLKCYYKKLSGWGQSPSHIWLAEVLLQTIRQPGGWSLHYTCPNRKQQEVSQDSAKQKAQGLRLESQSSVFFPQPMDLFTFWRDRKSVSGFSQSQQNNFSTSDCPEVLFHIHKKYKIHLKIKTGMGQSQLHWNGRMSVTWLLPHSSYVKLIPGCPRWGRSQIHTGITLRIQPMSRNVQNPTSWLISGQRLPGTSQDSANQRAGSPGWCWVMLLECSSMHVRTRVWGGWVCR